MSPPRPLAWVRRSLAAQLTVRYVAIVFLALCALGVFQYVALRSFMFDQVAATLVDQYRFAGRGPYSQIVVRASNAFVGAGVYDSSGNPLQLLVAPGQTWQQPNISNPSSLTQSSIPYQVLGGNVLAVVLALPGPDGTRLVLETSLEPTFHTLNTAMAAFVAAGLAALLLAGVAGHLATRSALRRVKGMAGVASEIAAGNLDRRAEEKGDDEVAALGQGFNQMVSRLQQEILRQQESESAMRRFLADASHELRTPLTAIQGNLDILRRGAASNPAELRSAHSDMRKSALRMSRLVSDLLTLTRLEGGNELPVQATEVRTLFQETMAACPPRDRSRVAAEVPEGLVLQANQDAMVRVLLNLVENALKYSPPLSPVEIRAGRDNGQVEIAVSNQGAGIAEGDQPRIFDRFYRADRARTAGGAGLGLAISAALVERQGGTIEVRSAPGEGATFTVRMPAAEAARPASPV